jgi:alpha-D-ribose 1-methylphosphonate 5-triphosphate synthase subunit PhnG
MDEVRGMTRIRTLRGTDYMVTESLDEVKERLAAPPQVDPLRAPGNSLEFVRFTSVTGQTLFPAEEIHIRRDQVEAFQRISDESWIWSTRATELHYARLLEATPQEQMAEAQQRLVEALTQDGDE